MGKVETLSPIHIGSGEWYYCFTIINDYRYPIEALIETCNNPTNLLRDDLLNKLSNEKQSSSLSNDLFYRLLGVNHLNVNKNLALYELDYYDLENKKIMEAMKEKNHLYIPGSTIKGYIENLIFLKLIRENNTLKNMIIEEGKRYRKEYSQKILRTYNQAKEINIINSEYNKKLSKYVDRIFSNVKGIFKFFGCRDIYFDNNPFLYNCLRAQMDDKKGGIKKGIPVGIVESINKGIIKENVEILFYPYNTTSSSNLKKSLIEELERKNVRDFELYNELIDQIYNLILKLKDWIKEENRKLIIYSCNKEIKCLERITRNEEVNALQTISYLKDIMNRVNNGELIFRLGKYTNYMLKSTSTLFYDNNSDLFIPFFSPNVKNKSIPTIDTLNLLMDDSDQYTLPCGFVKVEL